MFVLNEPAWVIRQLRPKNSEGLKEIYLSFDDGPSAEVTSQVLEILKKHDAKATFFVIGTQASQHKNLIQQMLSDGHTVLSHSIDHNYLNYFKSKQKLKDWLKASLEQLQDLAGTNIFGFRPPAGILTPPLLKVSAELELPLILWNRRFFDSVQKLTVEKIQSKLNVITTGDIVLLHDQQKTRNQRSYFLALDFYITELRDKEYIFKSIKESDVRELCRFT